MGVYLTVEIGAGTSIKEAASEAITLARRTGVKVQFTFNEVLCIVDENDRVEVVVHGMHTEMDRRAKGRVRHIVR